MNVPKVFCTWYSDQDEPNSYFERPEEHPLCRGIDGQIAILTCIAIYTHALLSSLFLRQCTFRQDSQYSTDDDSTLRRSIFEMIGL